MVFDRFQFSSFSAGVCFRKVRMLFEYSWCLLLVFEISVTQNSTNVKMICPSIVAFFVVERENVKNDFQTFALCILFF